LPDACRCLWMAAFGAAPTCFKALALGASAVFIGRPYLYGLGAAGETGVMQVINILQREFQMAMALTGRTSIGSIDRSVIWA